ncbi:actin depolymerizing protein, partial [Morchella conica CCBAS932]
KIDRKSLEILADDDSEVYTSLETLAEELPDNTPRFVLLSYPLDLKSGRKAAPYVLLYYMPPTANSELRMLYAGAKELMRNTAEVGKVLEVAGEEDVIGVEEVLKN